MIRRILVIGSIGLALAGGARFALKELGQRRWDRRKEELLALAVFQPEARRPWEVRFESLLERLHSSPRFDEIVASPYRPQVAWGSGEPRLLDEFERVWLESLWNELTGLDAVLAALRKLPTEELEWHGDTAKLSLARELTNALCGRAWQELGSGNGAAAVLTYADALRLARATDDGTTIGTMVRCASEDIVLRAVRGALGLGASPSGLRRELAPLLARLGYEPVRAERVIRRDLSLLASLDESEEPWNDPAYLLAYFRDVESGIASAHRPASELEPVRAVPASAALDAWRHVSRELHIRHVRRNVALTALAVAAFRERHGRYPESLAEIEDLAAEHSLDPLTEKRLPYSHSDAGARIGPATTVTDQSPEELEASLDVWTLR